jgi:hypothetical protein
VLLWCRYWLIEGGHSGKPTQYLYHVPQDWLVEGTNALTVLEELSGVNPAKVQLVLSQMKLKKTAQAGAAAVASE